jgi:hypothetical protein
MQRHNLVVAMGAIAAMDSVFINSNHPGYCRVN